jgi:hypothetical protein
MRMYEAVVLLKVTLSVTSQSIWARKPQRKIHLGGLGAYLSMLLKWNSDGVLIKLSQYSVYCKNSNKSTVSLK